MSDNNTATIRTTWNGIIVSVIIVLAAKYFNWTITVDDLLPYMPAIGAVIAVVYRLSLVVSEKWPKAGWVLFGKKAAPTYAPPAPPK
jgi:hypothetical protein